MDTSDSDGRAAAPLTAAVFHELIDELRGTGGPPPPPGRAPRRGEPARRLQVDLHHPGRGPRRPRVGGCREAPVRGHRRAQPEVGRRQLRRLLPVRPHRPTPHLRGQGPPGGCRLPVTDRVRRPERRPLLRAHRGNASTTGRSTSPRTARLRSCSAPRPTTGRGSGSSPTRCVPSPATTSRTRTPGCGPPGPSRPPTRPPPGGRTTRIWPDAFGPRSPGCVTRPRSSPSPSGPRIPSTSRTRSPPRRSAGPPATRPMPWAASRWTTTRHW